MAITGRQLRNPRVEEYRSSTISDDVGVRLGTSGIPVGFHAKLFWSIKPNAVSVAAIHIIR